MKTYLAAGALIWTMAQGSVVAWAQDAFVPQGGRDEASEDGAVIVVTGVRKLDTPLQDVAVSASSLDEDIFRNSASTGRLDVLRTVPGVTVLNLGGRSTIVIRGTGTAPDGDPNGAAAASYIGDIALSGLSGSRENVDLSNYDIERIDVLRGPQGFSYGGGAISGVVRTLPKPADPSEFSASIAGAVRHVATGKDFGYEVDGYLNLPVVRDKVGLRLTAYANREENPIFSARYNRQGSPATVEGGRISLRLNPTDNLTIDARYLYEQRELMDITRTATTLGNYVSSDAREENRKKTHLGWVTAQLDLGFATATYSGSYLTTDERGSYAAFFAGNTADGAELQTINLADASAVTQEFRVSNDDRHGLDWTLGAYYERRKSHSSGTYYLLDTMTPASTEFDFDGIDDPDAVNYTGSIYERSERQKSLFGEIGYWLNDELGLTIGTRYLDHSASTGYSDKIEGVADATPVDVASFPNARSWWKKVNLTWTPRDGQLYYAQFAEVKRPGGTNYGAIDASCPAEYQDRVREFYAGDRMRTWEAGAKLSGIGGRAAVNVSAYYSRWKNAPTYTGALCDNGVNFYIDNAGTIELKGVEMDAQLRISRTLSASMSAAYGIATIVSVSPTFTGGVVGDRTPGNPDWKVSGSLDYSQEVASELDVFGSAEFSYTGHYLNGLSVDWSTYAPFATFPGLGVGVVGQFPSGVDQYNDPGAGDYVLFKASAGLRSDNWTLTLFVDNLFGDKSRSLINYLNLTPDGEATITRVTPRTVGIRVERRF